MERAFVVIGAGVAGTSSLYYLSEHLLKGISDIHCFDDGSPNAPSRDKIKISRIDYADMETMKRAILIHEIWQTQPDFKSFVEKKTRLVAYRSDERYQQIVRNRKELGLKERQVLSSQEVRERYRLQLPGNVVIVLEEDDLLINLSECIKGLLKRCEGRGVKFFSEHVKTVEYLDGSFSGVILADDRKIDYPGATVILAAGPWSESLLLRSGKQASDRMAKCIQCFVFLIEGDINRTDPIVSELGKADFTPYEDRHAKLTWISTYTRPEPEDDSKTFLALQSLLGAIKWFHETILYIKKFKVTEILSWSDGMCEGENPLVAKDPADQSTIIIHGLSYTFAKGLPYLGKEVTSIAIDGLELHPSHGWSPEQDPLRRDNQPFLRPRGTFSDLNERAKEDPEVITWKRDHPDWEENSDIVPYFDGI